MNLKEKMKQGPVYGVAVFTGAACAVEAVGNQGYDFVFLDLEHTPLDAGNDIEKLILCALRSGVSPLVRTADQDEVVLRKLVEMGAEGVIVPQVAYAFKRLVELARPRGIGVMAPCVPPTPEYARELIAAGANMLIMGNDMWHFQKSIGKAMEETVSVMRRENP